ncbi:hypothetical protein LTR62_001117 [Meristemomyces frigidus]|uniref:DNA replication regulator SLD2 n=1 Tax=Meristemomyces frigidus TaxID=1508187 RepID=A0AAN7TLQ5_9PEZI|nr:hypothetical protein LTR62_001117 [Meristemomyces frigidus]
MASGFQILEKQVAELRAELKAWEGDFAKRNGGRKASREDISADAIVSNKYREFHRLRRPIRQSKEGQLEARSPPNTRIAQRASPHKRDALREGSGNAVTATPSRRQKSVMILDVVDEEEQEVEATPAFIRCALGPTPQKDGQVLGLFDMPVSATPSRTNKTAHIPDMPSISCTPSKSGPSPASPNLVPSATPQSSSKRRMLDAFAGTPLKKRKLDDQPTPSTSKRHLATPSFLRRSFPLAPVEEEDGTAVAKAPQQKRGLVRSLSSIIRGLRQHEDKRMDDEWDIMNELEGRGEDNNDQGAIPVPALSAELVADSQPGLEMPLGPDQGAPLTDSEEDERNLGALGADGQPRKVWKKKGLKRQTKRSNMKPVLHAPQKAAELEEAKEGVVARETTQAEAGEDTDGKEKDGAKDGKEADAKGGKKKVAASAHANFRRLKIKNKNSKANGRGGGKRFGRR